jgi:hypothetical protein
VSFFFSGFAVEKEEETLQGRTSSSTCLELLDVLARTEGVL